MGLTEGILGWQWLTLGWIGALVGVTYAAIGANWAQLSAEKSLQHSFFGAAVILAAVWQFRAGISPGLSIHILGMTTLTLMLGWELAVFAGLLALVLVTATGHEMVATFGVNTVVSLLVPVLVTNGIMLWERWRAFRSFFAYLFICGFFGASIAVACSGLSMLAFLYMGGGYGWETLYQEYIIFLPLIMFPEGFVNGAIVVGMMVFFPQRLLTLDESRYL